MINVVGRLAEAITDPAQHDQWMDGIDEQSVMQLKVAVVARLDSADVLELVSTDDAGLVLFNWFQFGAIRKRFGPSWHLRCKMRRC